MTYPTNFKFAPGSWIPVRHTRPLVGIPVKVVFHLLTGPQSEQAVARNTGDDWIWDEVESDNISPAIITHWRLFTSPPGSGYGTLVPTATDPQWQAIPTYPQHENEVEIIYLDGDVPRHSFASACYDENTEETTWKWGDNTVEPNEVANYPITYWREMEDLP